MLVIHVINEYELCLCIMRHVFDASIYAIQPSLVHCERLTDTPHSRRYIQSVYENTKKYPLVCNSASRQNTNFPSGIEKMPSCLIKYPENI